LRRPPSRYDRRARRLARNVAKATAHPVAAVSSILRRSSPARATMTTRLRYRDKFFISIIRFLFKIRPIKGRNLVIRSLLPLASIAPSAYGPLLRVRSRDFTNRASIFGFYGSEIPNQIRKLGSGDVFFDIGANTGIFSLVASDIVKPGFVFAFEPDPETFSDLCFNIQANGKRNVVALNLAISNATHLFTITHNPAHSGLASVKRPRNGTVAEISRVEEHIVVGIEPQRLEMLRDLTRDRRIGIKIDVEGHEFNVLQGLQKAGLLDRASWVIVEINEHHLGRHEASASDVYEIMRINDFVPAKGLDISAHYDETFLRR